MATVEILAATKKYILFRSLDVTSKTKRQVTFLEQNIQLCTSQKKMQKSWEQKVFFFSWNTLIGEHNELAG